MPKPSLELSRIPTSTIAEWRTEEGLQRAHFASETLQTYSTLHATTAEYLSLVHPLIDDQSAVSTGIALAEVAHFREASIGLRDFPDVRASARVIGAIIHKMASYTEDVTFTNTSIGRVQKSAPVTLGAYERAAISHVEGDERRLVLARRGAAFMHSILRDVEDVAQEAAQAAAELERRESYRAPVINLAERLSLAQ